MHILPKIVTTADNRGNLTDLSKVNKSSMVCLFTEVIRSLLNHPYTRSPSPLSLQTLKTFQAISPLTKFRTQPLFCDALNEMF